MCLTMKEKLFLETIFGNLLPKSPGSFTLAGPGVENSAAMGPRLLWGVITCCWALLRETMTQPIRDEYLDR